MMLFVRIPLAPTSVDVNLALKETSVNIVSIWTLYPDTWTLPCVLADLIIICLNTILQHIPVHVLVHSNNTKCILKVNDSDYK